MKLYKILVTGDREFTDEKLVWNAIKNQIEIANGNGYRRMIIFHGGAGGADEIAGRQCKAHGIHAAQVTAIWEQYGRMAGPIRNEIMVLLEPDVVLAFHNNLKKSKGTKNCINKATVAEIPVKLFSSGSLLPKMLSKPKERTLFEVPL